MKYAYVLCFMREGFQDLSVFSSLEKAREEFDKVVKKYNLKEGKYTYYVAQAYAHLDKVGEQKNNATLVLMKKIVNFNSIL